MTIADNLQQIHSSMAEACKRSGRSVNSVRLVAVSKTVDVERIAEAMCAGQLLFGENYVQSAREKIEGIAQASLAAPAEFHLIGNLQRNKAKLAVQLFSMIESVDRLPLAQEISKVAVALGKRQQVLLQVNISREESKSGIFPEQASELAGAIAALPGVELRGLMCIGSWYDDAVPETDRRKEFIAMRELRDSLAAQLKLPLPELSMGMSGDFAYAIEEGATLVRVGTAIFGERPL